jgi:hypothetical protein
MVWQQLSSRLSKAQEGRGEAQLLLKAIKLAISGLRMAPLMPDGRHAAPPPTDSWVPLATRHRWTFMATAMPAQMSTAVLVLSTDPLSKRCTQHLCVVCRVPAQRAIALAMLLADLAASGVPVDAVSIAAAVVTDGVVTGHIPMNAVHAELGMDVRSHDACSRTALVP